MTRRKGEDMPKPRDLPPIQLLGEALRYSPRTGRFTWKQRPLGHFASLAACNKWNKANAGKRAGKVRKTADGYQFVALGFVHNGESRSLPAHRVAWLLMTRSEPPAVIDHIDGDTKNNRWDNLRDGRKLNQRNARMRSDNTSGVTGVTWDAVGRRWRAEVRVSGKKVRLGSYAEGDIDIAAMEVMEARAELGFTARHGF